MTRLGTWIVRGSLGETPASVMRRTTTGLRSVGSATRKDAVLGAVAGSEFMSPTDQPDPIPAQVYEPGPLDDAHREYAGAELDALIGACNRGRWIAVAVPETDRNN
jgi:hypothetical protein